MTFRKSFTAKKNYTKYIYSSVIMHFMNAIGFIARDLFVCCMLCLLSRIQILKIYISKLCSVKITSF